MPEPINPDHPVFVRVPAKVVPPLVSLLCAMGLSSTATAVEEFTRHYLCPALNERRLSWIAAARARRARDGDIEFDDDSTISESDDDGEYVLAWVWVDAR